MHRRSSDHLPSWPTYLVAEISDPLAPAASFNYRYIVPPSAAEHFQCCWPTALEHFTVRGDVGAVAGDLPQATEFAQSFPDIHMHLVNNYADFRRLLKGHNVWLRLRRLVTLLFLGAVYKYTY